jgi:hypothetical protein
MHKELKEHLIKKLINRCMRIIDKLVPEPQIHYPQTRMVEHVFQQLFHIYGLEVYGGRFDDVSYQALGTLKDRNFQHFLSATRKILFYIGENDRYYRAWIGLAFSLAKKEYDRTLNELSRAEFLKEYEEQWELAFHCIPEEHFQLHKSEFLDMMLAAHLPNLLRETIPKWSCPQNKE